jgi:putative transposase
MFRARNSMPLFKDDDMCREWLALLAKYKQRYGIQIHAYVIMHTHAHLVVTATTGQTDFSRFFCVVHAALARFYNRKNECTGQVIMERLRTPRIEPNGQHLLTVMRYIDLNPVKAGLVKKAKDWVFSSFKHYAYGQKDELIDDAPDFLALAQSARKRAETYLHLFAKNLIQPLLQKRSDLTTAHAIGSPSWVVKLAIQWRLVSRKKRPPSC